MKARKKLGVGLLLMGLMWLGPVGGRAQQEQALEQVAQEPMAQERLLTRGCRRGTLLPRKVLRRSASYMYKEAIDADLYRGDRRQLVVLASYSDRPFQGTESEALALWNKILNQKNLSEAPFVGSVHDYFYAQSDGQFRLSFDLQYVEVGEASKYQSTSDDDENSQYLVDDVLDTLLERDIDWSLYDWNDDGEVEHLLIIYAGKGMADGGTNCIWPHQWWLSMHQDLTKETDSYREARTFLHEGKTYTVDCYCAVNELGELYHSFGVLCHEYSHCFGFPDFYSPNNTVLNRWDIMDSGYYTKGGTRPVNYSAHERMLMGWLTPTELRTPVQVVNMPALSDEPRAYIIRNEGHPDEFYMVENRQPKGWDALLPGSGLLVFHVDFAPQYWFWPESEPNSRGVNHYTIVPANNQTSPTDASGWAYPYMGNDELTNTSAPCATLFHPNTDGSLLMNKSLTGIAVADGLAAFDFMADATGMGGIVSPQPSAETPSSGWYTLSGMRLSERPVSKGLYLRKGKKVLVK